MPKTVLVVDDQASLRQMVRFALQFQGLNVVEAENGREALAQLAVQRIDLVVTDWKMPEMDGLELIRRIRQTEGLEALPIVLVSCVRDIEAKREAQAAGTMVWLQKPFRMSEIQTVVETALLAGPGVEHSLPLRAGNDGERA